MPINAHSSLTGGTSVFALFAFTLCVYFFGSLVMGLVSVLVWFQREPTCSQYAAKTLSLARYVLSLFVHDGNDNMLLSNSSAGDRYDVLDSEQNYSLVGQCLTKQFFEVCNPERAYSSICMT